MFQHQLSRAEAARLARQIGVADEVMVDALSQQGMLLELRAEVVDELETLATLLEDLGTVSTGGEVVEDGCARAAYVAGHYLRRIIPDVEALRVAAHIDY